MCAQNSNFVPDITIGSIISDVTFASTLSIPSHPTYGSAWQNKKILITGKLVLDQNVAFVSCKVKMQPGAEIVTQNASTMYSRSSSFFACSLTWKGVKIQNDCGASISYSKFEDADAAFTIADGAYAYFYRNTFNRNNIGIQNDNAASGQTGLVFSTFAGNTFDCDSPLNQSWNSSVDFGDLSFAGIYLEKCVSTIGQFPSLSNTFKRQQFGIYALNSDVVVKQAKFENIIDGWQTGDPGGTGIYAEDGSLKVLEGFDNGGTPIGICRFSNCDFAGIHALDANLEVRYADVSGTYEFGIASEGNTYGETVIIQSNTISVENPDATNYNFGIVVDRSIASGTKPHNRILKNSITIAGGGGDKYGIAVTLGDQAIDYMEIIENEITVQNTGDNVYPIRIAGSNADNYLVNDNIVNFLTGQGSSPGRFGIMIDNCHGENGQVTSNEVNTDPNVTSNTASSCIDVRLSENWTFCYNTVNRGLRGFRFRGDCDPSFVKNNVIQAHERGLLIENSGASTGAIDQQVRHGNLWSTNSSDYGVYAAQCTPNPNFSRFYTEDNSLQKKPTNVNPASGWFILQTGPLNYCTGAGEEPPVDAFLSGLDSFLIASPPYSPESWEWKKRLVYKLLQYPGLRPSGSDAETFYNVYTDSVPGYLARVDYLLDQAMVIPSSLQDDLDMLLDQQNVIYEQIFTIENNWGNDSIDIYQTQWLAKKNLIDDLKDLADDAAQIEDQIRQNRISPLADVVNFNSGIAVTTDSYEDYQKQLNVLRIKLASGDPLTETDFSVANHIASETSGTEDVTEWWSDFFLSACKTPIETEERSTSQNDDSSSLLQQVKVNFKLNPNPATDIISVQFEQPFSGVLLVSDINSRIVMRQDLPENVVTTTINTANLSNGMYLVQVLDSNGEISASQKLIINK